MLHIVNLLLALNYSSLSCCTYQGVTEKSSKCYCKVLDRTQGPEYHQHVCTLATYKNQENILYHWLSNHLSILGKITQGVGCSNTHCSDTCLSIFTKSCNSLFKLCMSLILQHYDNGSVVGLTDKESQVRGRRVPQSPGSFYQWSGWATYHPRTGLYLIGHWILKHQC